MFWLVVSECEDGLEVISRNDPAGFYWTASDNRDKLRLAENPTIFKIIPGLSGDIASVTFELKEHPGYYLSRDMDFRRFNWEGTKTDASFYPRRNLFFEGYTSFQSASNTDKFIFSLNNVNGQNLTVKPLSTFGDQNGFAFRRECASSLPGLFSFRDEALLI